MGHWPTFSYRFLFGAFMDRDRVEIHKLKQEQTRPISSPLDLTSLANEGFIIWKKEHYYFAGHSG